MSKVSSCKYCCVEVRFGQRARHRAAHRCGSFVTTPYALSQCPLWVSLPPSLLEEPMSPSGRKHAPTLRVVGDRNARVAESRAAGLSGRSAPGAVSRARSVLRSRKDVVGQQQTLTGDTRQIMVGSAPATATEILRFRAAKKLLSWRRDFLHAIRALCFGIACYLEVISGNRLLT
jgi:hypothetical protein